ncbi:MAG TPA: ribonuclease H-like domain-containing protein, partial [Methanosarcina sp.]|nr:ribonuclease H-like domain-containing protein [Methanosarcina sp.]
MKILLLDVETAPNLVHVWGLWNQNVGTNQIMDSGYVLCFAAKWLGSNEITFGSVYHSKPKHMLSVVHKLIDEADAVIHYNGTKFDMPTLNKEFLVHGLTPPSPVKQIDLLKTARSQFKFPSNKLDYIAQALKVGAKTKHKGHELWIGCMNNDPESWATMEEYNINDVVILEKVYEKLKPWIKGHINYSVHSDAGCVCPNCGSEKYHRR